MKDFLKEESNTTGSTFFSNKEGSKMPFFQAKLEESPTNETLNTSCEGWENDPQSFCITAGKRFLLDQFNLSPSAERVDADGEGGCHVFFEDGVVLTVQRSDDKTVMVYISPLSTSKKLGTRICHYSYTCTNSGKLALVLLRCSGKGKP